MKNMPTSKPYCHELFENEKCTRMEALSTKVNGMEKKDYYHR